MPCYIRGRVGWILLAENQQVSMACVQRGGFYRRAGRCTPLRADSRAPRCSSKVVAGECLPCCALRFVDCEVQAFARIEKQRTQKVLAYDRQSDQARVVLKREVDGELDARITAPAVVDMNHNRLVAHSHAPATSGADTVCGGFCSPGCSGTSSTGRVEIRKKRSATLPSTSLRQPRRPCVPMTTRSASNSFAARVIRCAMSSPIGSTSSTRGEPLTPSRCIFSVASAITCAPSLTKASRTSDGSKAASEYISGGASTT